MTTQYDRRCSIVVADRAGKGIDFAKFRVKFSTRQFDLQSWNSLAVRIYNVAPATANDLNAGLYQRVIVQAGYQGADDFGIIFNGQIKRIRQGRESQTDTYVDVLANDGALALGFATVSDSRAAGANGNDIVDICKAALAAYGIGTGHIDDLSDQQFARGQPIEGKVVNVLRELCQSAGANFSIIDNQLQILKHGNSVGSGPAAVLTRKTGLIGMPEQTPAGVQFRCLLNPKLKPGCLVKLDSESINRVTAVSGIAETGAAGQGRPFGSAPSVTTQGAVFDYIPQINNTNGTYKVVLAEHRGDTRGQEWYTDGICIVPGDAPPVLTARGLN